MFYEVIIKLVHFKYDFFFYENVKRVLEFLLSHSAIKDIEQSINIFLDI